jgi:phosphatidylinositol glycan class B
MPTLTSAYTSSHRVVFSDYVVFCREVAICGSLALLISGVSDRLYFGEWTFPAYQWLHFNVAQDLAVFYGRNDWHYFLSQGLPLLLTAYLPFTLVALYQTTSLASYDIRSILSTIVFVVIASLSLISHKEVRFIYPLLPILHLLTAPTIAAYFQTSVNTSASQPKNQPASTRRKPLLAFILSLHVLIAGYTSVRHQRGVISVTSFLRQEYERVVIDGRGRFISSPEADAVDIVDTNRRDFSPNETFAAFLMPCHSTPWRSQLIHPGLKAWALTCDPPIHIPASDSAARAAYKDEGDRFYDNIPKFLDEEVGGKEKPWPMYVVGFQGIEEELRKWYNSKGWGVMTERWRTANSDWHDDQKRVGDVVVWQFGDSGTT